MDLPLFFTLPLIGGFTFATGFFVLRWRSARQDSQRLYYSAAIWGVTWTAVGAILHLALMVCSWYSEGFTWLFAKVLSPLLTSKDVQPDSLLIRAHVALICTYALGLGIALVFLGRALLWITNLESMRTGRLHEFVVGRNLAAIKDPLEGLLSRSLVSGEAIQVTLSTGKVYVGYVLEALDPDLPTKFIKLQPLMSGQRSTDGQVQYTTFYDQILTEFEANPETKSAVDSFQVVIPVDKTASMSGFSLDAYVHFLGQKDSEPKQPEEPGGQETGRMNWALLAVALLAVSRLS